MTETANSIVRWQDTTLPGVHSVRCEDPAIREISGSISEVGGMPDTFTGELHINVALRRYEIAGFAAMKESAARTAVEEALGEYAEAAAAIQWRKIDINETTEDGGKIWAYSPDCTEAVWNADCEAGNATIEQRKDEFRFPFQLTFRPDDSHFPWLRYKFEDASEAKRIGSLLCAVGGLPPDESFQLWH